MLAITLAKSIAVRGEYQAACEPGVEHPGVLELETAALMISSAGKV
jgi:hypothetical protein